MKAVKGDATKLASARIANTAVEEPVVPTKLRPVSAAIARKPFVEQPLADIAARNAADDTLCVLATSVDGTLHSFTPAHTWVPATGYRWDFNPADGTIDVHWQGTWRFAMVDDGFDAGVPFASATVAFLASLPRHAYCGDDNVYRTVIGDTAADLVLAELDAMIGLASLKARFREEALLARVIRARQEAGQDVPDAITRHLVITGPPGTGKTTAAKLWGRLMIALGLLRSPDSDRVPSFVIRTAADFVTANVGGTPALVQKAFDSARPGTLVIDEAYQLAGGAVSAAASLGAADSNAHGAEAIDTLCALADERRAETAVVLLGYPAPIRGMLERNPGLNSRFPAVIELSHYTADELVDIAALAAHPTHTLSADAKTLLRAKYARALKTASPDYGNGRVARNDVDAAIRAQMSRIALTSGSLLDSTLTAEDFEDPQQAQARARAATGTSIDEALAPLTRLPGLTEAKAEIRHIVAVLTDNVVTGTQSRVPGLLFAGPPGTMKTSAAALLGKALRDLRVGSGEMVTFTTADLGFQGLTTPAGSLQAAYRRAGRGGVLFIDEASDVLTHYFATEGKLAEALKQMVENNPDRVLIVLAGYDDLPEKLAAIDPGLPSRFNVVHFTELPFPALRLLLDYQSEDLELRLVDEAADAAMSLLQQRRAECERTGVPWGNAREVSRLVAEADRRRATRSLDLAAGDPGRRELAPEDFA